MHCEEMSAAALEASRVIRTLRKEAMCYRIVSAVLGLGLVAALALLMLTV